MERYNLTQDMNLILYPAKNFPNDVESAFKELDKRIGGGPNRVWFAHFQGSPDGIDVLSCRPGSIQRRRKKSRT